MYTVRVKQSWRTYQKSLKKSRPVKRFNIIKIMALLFSIIALICFIAIGVYNIVDAYYPFRAENDKPIAESKDPENHIKLLTKDDLNIIFNNVNFANTLEKSFQYLFDGQMVTVETTIDKDLQNFVQRKLDYSKGLTKGKPNAVGIVAMEPKTGKVLCMAGFDKTDPKTNTCIKSLFPAASIFKIITATAAVEKCGLSPNSRMYYNGGKYTLYKRQIKDRHDKYTHRISFKDSFAQSINPVFGKLGALYLGKNSLERYASAFYFNQEIDFEIPMEPSVFYINNEPYQWAEIASGFNKQTLISPLHGAMLVSSILNQGNMVEPNLVDLVVDRTGKVLYQSSQSVISQTMLSSTSKEIKKMMGITIKSGTAKKSFRRYKRDRILSKLDIGGKTGSISSIDGSVKYDWFVGFGQSKKDKEELVVSIVVGHEKYIGIRSTKYGNMIIKEYFKNYFAKK